jgi:hypothetical protein
MKEKTKEFKQIETLREKYYPKIIKYYLLHIFKIDDDKRPDYTIGILCNVDDYFNFVEYAVFDLMKYYVLMYNYNIILNLHVKVDSNRTSVVDR